MTPRTTCGLGVLAAAVLALAGCGGGGTGGPPDGGDGGASCGPANCLGCCDLTGRCQTGTLPLACGISGRACAPCATGQLCLAGGCFTGGGTDGGGTDGGACDGGGVTACGPLCVSTATNAEHCGGCFSPCSVPNATPSCVASKCEVGECKPGFRDLDGKSANGCEASCVPFALSTSGSLDVDLTSVRVSGQVTLQGAAAPVGTSRGTLSFLLAGTSRAVTVSLPTSGPATFSAHLFTGNYRISFTKSSDCRADALPCGTQVLREAYPLTASGALDLDVKAMPFPDAGVPITVSGEVTVSGAAMPDATATRGTLELRREGTAIASAPLGTTGRATYSVQVPPGTYDVALRGPTSCAAGQPLPCHASVRRKALVVATSGSFNLDVQVMTVSGEVKANGAPLAAGTSTYRGQLQFTNPEGTGTSVNLPATGAATYSVKLYPGVHSVTVSNTATCAVGPLPCQSRKAVPSVNVATTPASLDIDLPVIALSGSVLANGAALSNGVNGASRGTLRFKDELSALGVSLGASGPATYQGIPLYAGDYDVEVSNTTDCVDGALPCGTYVYKKKASLTASGSYDVNLPVARVSGNVTVNAMPMAAGTVSRGQLSFSGPSATAVVLTASGAATFQLPLYFGTYKVEFAKGRSGDCPLGPTPCQSRVLNPALAVTTSGAIAFDLPVVELSGVVSVDGDGAPVSGRDRGTLGFRQAEAGDVTATLGVSGPAQYRLRLFPGTYDVFFKNDLDCSTTSPPPYPCQGEVTLRQAFAATTTGNLDFDVLTATISGLVRLNGAPLPDAPTGASRGGMRLGRGGAAGLAKTSLTASGPPTYSLRAVRGTYDLGFSNATDCPDGATPCQDVLVKGCSLP